METCSGYVYRKTVTTFKTFSLQICNVPWQFSTHLWYGVTKTSWTLNKTSWTLNKTLQKRVHVGFLFSLLHVLKMKFKGSGRLKMWRFWGDDHVLNMFYLGTSSSRSDDVEWFTGGMRRLIWDLAGPTYYTFGNLMSRLTLIFKAHIIMQITCCIGGVLYPRAKCHPLQHVITCILNYEFGSLIMYIETVQTSYTIYTPQNN